MKMTWKSVLIAMFVISALVCAYAANNSTTLTITNPIQVNGTKLDAGSYKVTWTVNGDKADVVFKNAKTEVKAAAKLEDAKIVYSSTAIMRTNDGVVKQLWVGGRSTTLIFAE